MIIDIISDLHIDFWNNNYWNKLSYSKKHYPFVIKETFSDILIVAGDISDDLDLSIKTIDSLSKNYKYLIFIDGNHEHINKYPLLYSHDEINAKIIKLKNNKIKYLPKKDFILNKTVFIGYCGWWDFSEKMINDYFKNYLPHLDNDETCKCFNLNVKKAIQEYYLIINKLDKYQKDNSIENIVLVTHTISNAKYVLGNTINTEFNSSFKNINNKKYNKLKNWIFGHTHKTHYEKLNNIQMICNPRGRPCDYNRINYEIKKLIL